MPASQEMFMLLFSVLYGIMLNSLIGLGAFPFAAALAGEDVERGVDGELKWKKANTCRYRLLISFVLINILPFTYFALVFQFIGNFIVDFSSPDPVYTTIQILSIGLLSLSVFAFYRFFLGLIVWKPCGNSLFYTEDELKRHIERRAIHPKLWKHVQAGLLYLIIPWLIILVIVLSRAIGLFYA